MLTRDLFAVANLLIYLLFLFCFTESKMMEKELHSPLKKLRKAFSSLF